MESPTATKTREEDQPPSYDDPPRGQGRSWPMTVFMLVITVPIGGFVLMWAADNIAGTWHDAWWVAAAVVLHLLFLTWGAGYCIRERATLRAAVLVMALPVTATLMMPLSIWAQLTTDTGANGEETIGPEMYVNTSWAVAGAWFQWARADLEHHVADGAPARISPDEYVCTDVDAAALRERLASSDLGAAAALTRDHTYSITAPEPRLADATYSDPDHGQVIARASLVQHTKQQPDAWRPSPTGFITSYINDYTITITTTREDGLWCVTGITNITTTPH